MTRASVLLILVPALWIGCSCDTDVDVLSDASVTGDADSSAPPDTGAGGDGLDEPDESTPDAATPDTASGDATDDSCDEDNDCHAELEPCQRSVCVEGVCAVEPVASGVACDDGDACTVGETCTDGQCGGGGPKACPASACTTAVCLPGSGLCGEEPKEDGTLCDDGSECTLGDACSEGVCKAATPCPEDCTNGADDDLDLDADCADSDCAGEGVCTGICLFVDTLSCGDSLTVDPVLFQTTSHVEDWCGGVSGLVGPEVAFAIAPASGKVVTVTVTSESPDVRALHLRESPATGGIPVTCQKDLCADEGSGGQFSFIGGGQVAHSVVVDGADGAPFEITVDCAACVAVCVGKQCGDDGCGGTCGSCGAGLACEAGLCVSPPPPPGNDSCGSAQPLPSVLPVLVTGTTKGAADDVALASGGACAGGVNVGAGAPDVLYTFTAGATGDYLFALYDAPFAAALWVATDCAASVAGCLSADTTATSGVTSVVVALSQGQKVFVGVDGAVGPASGPFVLSINTWPCAPACSGKLCGPDACGGSCGGCSAGQLCGPTWTCVVPSPNDTCATAKALVPGGAPSNGSTGSATDGESTAGGICGGADEGGGVGAADVVYTLTGPGKFDVTVTPSGFDALVTARAGCPAVGAACLGGSDAPGVAVETLEDLVVPAGQTVFIIIDGATAGEAGAFSIGVDNDLAGCTGCGSKLCGFDDCGQSCGSCGDGQNCVAGACVVGPSNDACPTAATIPALPFEFSGSTVGAANDLALAFGVCTDGPQATTYGKGPDVVFKYTPSQTGPVTFQTDPGGTTFTPYVYVEEICGAPTEATCWAGSTGTLGVSTVKVTLTAGKTYYIVVDGLFASQFGTYLFRAF